MNKKHFILSALLFLSILPMTLFSGCDKDTNCYLDVLVVDNDTKAPIPGAIVKISQDGGTVSGQGITGGDGIYSTHFGAPAIITIKVTVTVRNDAGQTIGERRGETSARLIDGETVTAKINVTNQVY